MSRTRIGPYEVRAKIGEGGMGEVFKAWDPRLERDVAIKLLHPDSALDPDRQRRLLAEGRAASALCHPNILRVYDADVDGASYYLVSEWLEGKSLRDELSRGPLPLKRLLDLSVQIADGLAAAHAIGIVHRDIKPENVMLARDGTARIVDFGLARSDPHSAAQSTVVGHATTVSLEGGLSGTPAYMSPEQARGTGGDFRTDQFSFGALVYEMATGSFAFRRDSVADTMSAVLHEEPKPIAELNPRVPAPFRWMLERCLAKDASERYAATEDLARELRGMRDHWSEALAEPKAGEGPRVTTSRWRMPIAAGTAAVAGLILGLGLHSFGAEDPIPRFTPLASASEYEGTPGWSPDGQSLVYVADVNGVLQVFVKRISDALSRQVTQGQFDAQEPFWAPDGQRIYFISLAGTEDGLWSVGVAGGRPELIVENVAHAAIDREGSRLALLRGDNNMDLWWSSPPRAEPQKEMRPPFNQLRTAGGELRFSPDGQLLVWTYDVRSVGANSPQSSEFYVFPKGSEAPRKVLSALGSSNIVQPFDWLPDNRHVIVALTDARGSSQHLWLADTRSDASHPITATHTNETAPAVSPDGRRIAYASDEVDFDLMLISPDGGSMRTLLATARNEYDPAWAVAGDQFAFVTDRSGSLEIWARSRDGQWERPIVTANDFGSSHTETLGSLAFSPDGRTLAYQRGAQARYEIWLSPATGGTPTRLGTNQTRMRPYQDSPTWSPDGEWLAFHEDQADTDGVPRTLVKRRIGTDEIMRLSEQVGLAISRPVWSPDGQWIAEQTEDGLVRVAADGGKSEVIDSSTWLALAWASDSRKLYGLGESETSGHFALMEIDPVMHRVTTLNPDLGPIPIANQPIRGFSYVKGQGFLTSLASARSDIWLLEGFQQPQTWLKGLLQRGR